MIQLFNTLTRQEEPFAPSLDNVVRMYACGPTVYARAHIGNFRTYVCLDVLRRTLKYVSGYQVREAINYTDVDDKTIAGANEAGVPLREYTEQWIQAFRDDTARLGIEEPEERPRATDEQNLRVAAPLDRVAGAGVVEARVAPHPEGQLASDRLRATHEVVRHAGVLHRHEVRYFGDAAVGQEPGEQHVGVGQVELSMYRVVEPRRDLEAAAAIGVEERGKHRG